MNGNGDYIQTPSITFTECIIEMSATPQVAKYSTYFDANVGVSNAIFVRDDTGNDFWQSGISAIYKDGVLQTSNTPFVNSTKSTYHIVLHSVGTDNVNIFSGQLGAASTCTQGKLYNIKFYNGAALVAYYDMTTGTVQDQSGNGKHATLVGGTWVDETPTGGFVDGSATLSINADLTANGSIVLSGVATLTTDSQLTVNAEVLTTDVGVSLSATSDLNTTANVIVSGASVLSADTTLSVIPNVLVSGVSSMSTDSQLNVNAEVIAIDTSIALGATCDLNVNASVLVNGQVDFVGSSTITINGSLISKYENIIEITFKINRTIETEINIKRELQSDFEINREIETVFKI